MKMKNVFLTIHIDANDKFINHEDKIKCLNLSDIVKSKRMILKVVGEYETLRVKMISDCIRENQNDLLIGNAITKKRQLTEILKLIDKDKSRIEKIFYDDGKRKSESLKKYEKDYKLHSNWMDYSPEHVKHLYEKVDSTIKDIILEAKSHKIKVMAI